MNRYEWELRQLKITLPPEPPKVKKTLPLTDAQIVLRRTRPTRRGSKITPERLEYLRSLAPARH